MNKNIYQLFQSKIGKGVFLKNEHQQELYSYDDLDKISAQYANYFASLGLEKGDRVIVQVEKSAHNLFIYFACLRSGLIYLPLNTAYQADELMYFVENAEPALVICDPASLNLFSNITGCESPDPDAAGSNTEGSNTNPSGTSDNQNKTAKVMTLGKNNQGSVNEKLEEFPTDHSIIPCDSDDVAVILYTSGTTGKPKGAMISHGNLTANGLALLNAWGWQKDDVMLHALPIFHIHGLFVAINLPVLNASPVIFLDKFDASTVIKNLPQATVYMGVPTNYTRLLANESFNKETCRNMRLFTSGSAPLLPQTFDEFEDKAGLTIVERYGMTETGMNTSNPLSGKRKPGTVGLPLKGVSVKVVDSEGEKVKVNVTGDLLVKGDNLFKGYWKLPDKTRTEFTVDGYFKTGDLAQFDDEGYVSIVGRNKDMIISGGLNIYPIEIEAVIDKMEGVVESAVIGIPHPDFGEAVTAVVVRSDDALTEDNIKGQLKSKLANFKAAKQVHFVDVLPRNAMGKVQKNILREQFNHQRIL